MPRGAILTHPIDLMLLVQRSLTIALSGYNALYFATYLTPKGGRRLGAVVLTLINIAVGAESLAFLLLRVAGKYSGVLNIGGQLAAASLSLAAVLVMAALIFRRRIRRR